jgi:hypothetical protein
MRPRPTLGFLVVLALLIVAGGVGLASQWRQTLALRGELELLRLEAGDLAQLRAENQRLRERQIPAAELELLRADHAALPRLRAELEALSPARP